MAKKKPAGGGAAVAEPVLEQQVIKLQPIDRRGLRLTIVGESPLIVHAWSHKAIQMLLSRQMQEANVGKEAKDPHRDFCDSLYWLSEKPANPTLDDVAAGTFGLPAVAIKSTAVEACRYSDGLKMTNVRGSFHVIGEIIPIIGDAPQMRQDMVRIGAGVADVRFRGAFKDWKITFDLTYNSRAISADQIVNLYSLAGFGCGLGEWRPQRDGSYGRFRVE